MACQELGVEAWGPLSTRGGMTMPEHRSRGRTRRGMAIALIVPAAVVAGIFTAAGLATGTPGQPAAQPTDGPQLPSEIQPPRDTATGPGGGTGTTPGTTGTTRSPTGTRTSPGVPGV